MLDRKGTHWSTRLFAAFLAFVMLLGNVPVNVFATEITGEEVQDTTVPETGAPAAEETEPETTETGIVHTHEHTSMVTAPTCTEQGYTTHTCACGDSYVDSYVDAVGHSYENGICTGCGSNVLDGNYTHAIPENQGVQNAIDRAYSLTDVEWTPLADVPGVKKINGEFTVVPFEAGKTYRGIPYSGVTANDCYVGLNVSLESFLTALKNKKSVLYTENLFSTNPKSATYFGTVCSKFAQYVLDIPGSYNTNNVANIPGMETIAMPGKYTVDQIKLGDVVLHTQDHTTVCTDILYDAEGNVAFIEISEAVLPLCRRLYWSPEEFYEHFAGYRLCRYQYVNEVPALDENELTDGYALMPRFGDKYNYKVSSTQGIVDVLESGYHKAVILRDGVIIDEIVLNGATSFKFDRSVPGYLEMYLEKQNGTRSGSVYACVVKSSVTVTNTSLFTQGNLTVTIDGSCGTPVYVQVGSAHAIFCNVEGKSGTVEISFPFSKVSSKQVRVAYQNEYGIYLSDWSGFTTAPNTSQDAYLSQGGYWDGYTLTPSSHTPVVQSGKTGYWTYTMIPVEENATYYSKGCNRMWFLDAKGNPITTFNANTESGVRFQFTTPEGTAYVSITYAPSGVDKGTESIQHIHTYENGTCTLCGAEMEEPVWEQGTIAYATGLNRDDTTRIRTAGYLKLEDYAAVTVNTGYMLVRFVYDQDYKLLSGTDWLGDGIGFSVEGLKTQFPGGVYFRVALCAKDNRVLTPDDVAASGITFLTEAPEIEMPLWEQGTIASVDGTNNSTASRFRTAAYHRLSDYSGVGINTGYTMTNFVYDESYTYLGTSSWLGSGIPFTTAALQEKYPTGVYFRVVFRADDQRNLTEADVAASGVKFYLPGEEVPTPEFNYSYENIASIGSWQDGAIWNGKLFALGAAGTGAVFDVKTGAKLGSIQLDGVDVLKPHANSVCFGSTYYAAGDDYPLLYVNIYNNYASAADRMEGTCCVYRVMEKDGRFATELVQVIKIGFTEDLNLWKSKENNGDVRPYGNFVVDTDEDVLYAFVMRDANKTTRFFAFDIPAIGEGVYNESYGCNVVTLETGDIKNRFDIEYHKYLQGCSYHGGKILYVGDFGGDAPLLVVDLKSQKVTDVFSLGYLGLSAEPEVICADPADGNVYYAAADGMLRKLTLPVKFETPKTFAGKTISILGDSISTYTGVSNNTSYNETLGGGAIYYTAGRLGVYQADTWWQQTIDALGMELLVNNSWSGSCVFNTRSGTVGAYIDRAVQLHNTAGEEPDVIAVFLGTNDFTYYQGSLGTADIDYSSLIAENDDGTCTYATPTTSCEAYAIMLHKMTNRYPDAEIYCMSLLPRRNPAYSGTYKGQPTAFNTELAKIIEHFGCTVVDLENCGITSDPANYDQYIADKLVHPGPAGMDEMTEALISAMLGEKTEICDISSTYTGIESNNSANTAIIGGSYKANLTLIDGYSEMNVTVMMNGIDVTDSVYTDGIISIDYVAGDILITGTASKAPDIYRWELDGDTLVSTGMNENIPTLMGGSVSGGIMSNAYYRLAEEVILRHNLPWVLELKVSGSWSGMIFSAKEASSSAGNTYLFKSREGKGLIAFGEYSGSQYNNYGIPLIGAGIDISKEHTYRFENRIADDGSNMVYLLVDGAECGAMNNYFIAGSNDQKKTVDWLSGKDLRFPYIGASGHAMNGCAIDYIQVWENGKPSFEGKTVSILGDSISTYAGVSNNTSYNSTLGKNIGFYPVNDVTTQSQTWWQQVIDLLGMKLLVNNSSGGGRILSDEKLSVVTNGTFSSNPRNAAAYKERCVNLHNANGENPDVILVFLGTNDFSYHLDPETCGVCKTLAACTVCNGTNTCKTCVTNSGLSPSFCPQDLGTADIRENLIAQNQDGTFAYLTPETTCEAYAVMLHKMKQKYPDAEIFCMGLLARRDPDYAGGYHDHGQPTAFNSEMKELVERFGATFIDLENCGISKDASVFDRYIYDKAVHPNAAGMDKITEAVVSAMLGGSVQTYEISANLTNVTLEGVRLAVSGSAYTAKLTPDSGYAGLDVTVTMGGRDITESVYADGVITIPAVTGKVIITASAIERDPKNFRWEFDGSGLVSKGKDDNSLKKLAGSVTNGFFSNTRYQLDDAIILRHDRPWVLEWKGEGSGGFMLAREGKTNDGNKYFFHRANNTLEAFGYWKQEESMNHNYGVSLQNVIDTGSHKYRLENRIGSDGTNMVYLIVDERNEYRMDNLFFGGAAQGTTGDWISGKDFVFNHIGTTELPLTNYKIDYLAVWENGQPSLAGKTISILGASISTYAGTSNGAAADTTNSTIRNNAKYYPHSVVTDVALNDTWWMQAADDLGLRLLVNNSWSGSALLHERNGTKGAYVDRCVQLHDNTGDNAGEMPDIIAIQMGSNDFQYYKDTLGTADIDYAALIKKNADGTFTYATPVTSLEAAAIVLHKISVRYADAEVYYLNISQRIDGTDELIRSFNAELKQVVEHFGAHIVDIYGSGITMENFETYIGDGRVHPNRLGMDAYTEAFKKALLENTGYSVSTHLVTLDLSDVTADYGTNKTVVSGDAFRVKLTATAGNELSVTVTMGGEDITASAYSDGTVAIGAVTGDVVITAVGAEHQPKDYRWEFDGSDLVSVGETANALTKNAGTTTDGVFSNTRYALEKAVILSHDRNWIVEWKSEGTFKNSGTSTGARIFSSTDVNADYNARFIFKSATNWLVAMGEKDTKGSHNYGIALGDHGIDGSEPHTYRLENRIADDGSNMIWLFVDGAEIGPMNNYYIGTTSQKTTSDWLSGKDFVFPYMGTDTHGFTNASIEYIQIYESHTHSYTSVVTAPTCTEQGYTTHTCVECGDSYVDSYVDATGEHTYENGICIVCGMTDPDSPFPFLADVYMIPCYGQSLSINSSAGISTYNYTEPLSFDVNLTNTNIQDMCAGTAEGFRLMAEYCNVELPENFKIIGCTGGGGGKSVQQLSKGSTYYNNVINAVKAAKASCDAAGLTMIVPCFTWTQGEEDMRAGGNPASYGMGGYDPNTYKDRLKQLIDDFNADIKAITGQTTDVLCISYQVASHTSYARYPRIAMQQQELAMEDDRMILAKVMYDVDYVTEGDAPKKHQVHAPAATYRNMGNMYGIAAFKACVLGEKVESVHPIDWHVEGNKLYIRFEVPYKPLKLDDVLINNLPDGNYGFQIYYVDEQTGNSGFITKGDTEITKVELYNEDTVLLTLSQPPLPGETLTYGINGDYWQNINGTKTVLTGGEGPDGITKSGREYGARGCLRDSQPIKNTNSGAVYQDLYNWAVIFEIPFTEENLGTDLENRLPDSMDADARDFVLAAKIWDMNLIGEIDVLVHSLKEAGLWDKIDALYPCVGSTFEQMSYNLKNPDTYQLTTTGTVIVDKNIGFYSTAKVISDAPETAPGNDLHLLGYSMTKYMDVTGGTLCPGPSSDNGMDRGGVLMLVHTSGTQIRTSYTTNRWKSNQIVDGDGLLIGSLTSGLVYNGKDLGAVQGGTPNVSAWPDVLVHNGFTANKGALTSSFKVGFSGFGKGLTIAEMEVYSKILNTFKGVYEEEVPHIHTYESQITPPTCTEKGYKTHTCECGDSYVDSFVDAAGHSWANGVCTICGATKKPYQRLTYFTVDVQTGDGKSYTDNAVLYLPKTYSPNGAPVKLVIYCKQGASQITASSNPIEAVGFYNYLISLGYAVLGVDGVPDAWRDELGLGERAVGNPMAVQGTEKAYDYVIDNYNIAADGCFISGYSQGGHYAQNVIDLTDIPILAAAEQSPVCSMRYHQWDLNASQTVGGVKFTKAARLNVARIYGFPAVASNAELLNLAYDASLVAEYDPWVRNSQNIYTGFVQKSNLWYLPEGTNLDDITMTHTAKCPVKIWCAEDDTAISADVMKVFVKAIQNAGGVAEISVAPSGGHGFFQNQTAIGTFSENGKTYKMLPIAVEIAQWFARFGGYGCKHDYTSAVTAPTCTEQGYTTHTCTICGDSYVDSYVDAPGHKFGGWTVITEPTCTEKGMEQRNCKNCDYFETREVEASGHDYEAVATAPTCTEKGFTTHTCSKCGDSYIDSYVDATGHKFGDWTTTKVPTCTEKGKEQRECENCDHYETREVDASGHDYEAVVTDPTCVDKGYTTHTCHCGDSYVDGYVDAVGHKFGEWEIVEEPTCVEKGMERRECENCDHVETREVAAAGHDYEAVVTAPTCTEQGFTTHTCAKCGDSYTDSYVDAMGHKFGGWTVITEPTCTEKGEERRDCSNCDHYETREIAAAGHDYEATLTAPTCNEKGYTTHTCHCGDSYIDSYVEATGHKFDEWRVTTEPTCTVKGEEQRDCKNCDYYETREVDATGHDYEVVVTKPTCEDRGYTTHTCSKCGDSYIDSYVVATGHKFGKWMVTTEPTCTAKGEEQRDCKNCDHYETREVDATGHDYVVEVTAPTCTEKGYTSHTCSKCEDSYVDNYVDATGHKFGEWSVTTEPTCTVKGEEQRDCKNCDHYETREVDATGHDYVVEVTAPTCTERGYTSHTCSKCEDSYVDNYVDATGHEFGDWTVTTEPTCTAKGMEQRVCENCDHFEIREVAATGHDYEAVVTKPTCVDKGYTTHTCQCGDSYVDSYVNALGHKYENGSCSVCSEPEVKYLPGDVDLDGDVDVDDVLALLWYVLFPEEYPIEVDADFDRNGSTDVDDVLTLLWYVLFPEDYPLT